MKKVTTMKHVKCGQIEKVIPVGPSHDLVFKEGGSISHSALGNAGSGLPVPGDYVIDYTRADGSNPYFGWIPKAELERSIGHVQKMKDLMDVQADNCTDAYMRGMYNGMAVLFSVVDDEEPAFMDPLDIERNPVGVAPLGSFSWTLMRLKEGAKVARRGWNGKGMWLAHVTNGYFDVGVSVVGNDCAGLLPWIGMRTADQKFVPWLASQSDVLADDWEEIE